MKNPIFPALIAAASLLPTVASAAIIDTFSNRAAFLAAIGAAPVSEQDFSGFGFGASLDGVDLLPGVTATYSRDGTTIAPGLQAASMVRGTGLSGDTSVFTFDIDAPYTAFGFDVGSYNPLTPGPVTFVIETADGTVRQLLRTPRPQSEAQPFFFGVVSDDQIVSVAYGEGPEIGGQSTGLFTSDNCCEETRIDNLVAANLTAVVPLPATLPLAALGLFGLAAMARRRIAG